MQLLLLDTPEFASGIGKAISERLAAGGATVAIVDRNAEGAAAVAAAVSGVAITADLMEPGVIPFSRLNRRTNELGSEKPTRMHTSCTLWRPVASSSCALRKRTCTR